MSPLRRKDGGGRCPVCARPREEKFKPFCSKRCADIDLARWLDGRYAIPGKDTDENEGNEPARSREDE